MSRRRPAPPAGVVKESTVMKDVLAMLKILQQSANFTYERNHVGTIRVKTPSSMRDAYRGKKQHFMRVGTKGAPDIRVFMEDGKTLHMEVKTSKGRLNANQKAYKEQLESLGHEYVVVRSAADAAEALAERIPALARIQAR